MAHAALNDVAPADLQLVRMMRLSPSELAVQLEALDLKYTTQVPFPEINAAVVVMRSWFSSHQAWDGGFFGMRQNGKEDGMFRARETGGTAPPKVKSKLCLWLLPARIFRRGIVIGY